MKSTFLKLNWQDFFKGLIIAVLSPIFPIVEQSISAGELTLNWHLIGLAAAGGFVAYMAKNLFTDSVKQATNTLTDKGATVITPDQVVIPPTNEKAA